MPLSADIATSDVKTSDRWSSSSRLIILTYVVIVAVSCWRYAIGRQDLAIGYAMLDEIPWSLPKLSPETLSKQVGLPRALATAMLGPVSVTSVLDGHQMYERIGSHDPVDDEHDQHQRWSDRCELDFIGFASKWKGSFMRCQGTSESKLSSAVGMEGRSP